MLATTAFGMAGAGALATDRSALAQSSEVPTSQVPRGQRFGAGVYNTDQVAAELRHIESTVQHMEGMRPKRILITGSTAGVGQLAAAYLLRRGNQVVAHARTAQRASEVARDLPGIEGVVVGDLINLDETRNLAEQINRLGTFDVIVHNAGEYGLPDAEIINANSVSPYLLTALVDAPREAMVYLSSSLHTGGDLKLETLRSGGTGVNYNDSKLHMATLATAVARRRPGLRVNAVRPGWVATLMGFHNGPHAPDDLRAGYMTQVWLSEGADPASDVTGRFLFHQQDERRVNPSVYDEAAQDALIAAYATRTGVELA